MDGCCDLQGEFVAAGADCPGGCCPELLAFFVQYSDSPNLPGAEAEGFVSLSNTSRSIDDGSELFSGLSGLPSEDGSVQTVPSSSSTCSVSRRPTKLSLESWDQSARDLIKIRKRVFGDGGPRHKSRQRPGYFDVAPDQDLLDADDAESKWDAGHCLGMQLFIGSVILLFVLLGLAFAAALGDSYIYLQSLFDWTWGFALQDGYPYTAPVWMGEFGTNTRGRYWMHLLTYLSVRDVDFAYWSLDGLKFTKTAHDHSGNWVHFKDNRWLNETFGLLNSDYYTVRHPWKLLDLQAIMSSPAGWTADDYPCDRAVLGNACGG